MYFVDVRFPIIAAIHRGRSLFTSKIYLDSNDEARHGDDSALVHHWFDSDASHLVDCVLQICKVGQF